MLKHSLFMRWVDLKRTLLESNTSQSRGSLNFLWEKTYARILVVHLPCDRVGTIVSTSIWMLLCLPTDGEYTSYSWWGQLARLSQLLLYSWLTSTSTCWINVLDLEWIQYYPKKNLSRNPIRDDGTIWPLTSPVQLGMNFHQNNGWLRFVGAQVKSKPSTRR